MSFREKYWDWGILLNYAIAFFSILLAVICKQHWMVLIPVFCFLIHDIDFAYIGSEENFKCRTYEGTVKSITSASNYISYFIALIGIVMSVLVGTQQWDALRSIIIADDWIQAYGFIIIVLSGTSLLFIPIRYKEDGDQPSRALKNCFFAVLFFEKVIIIFLSYILIYLFLVKQTVQSFT